ncbi:hypothetical protein VP01_2098g2 [Puccinia sorghi]|uniref:Uncharacterized protein n=1 Tax=Puccinia sorghi TaxID=27349 RepID=A0A0L6VAU6_9BASI|nr:hypothetical protein VP01_2098g2 [Puccinia sorghi]
MEEEPQLVLNKDKPFVMKTLEEELDEISSKEILKPTSPDDEWEDVLEDELPEDKQATEIEEQPIVRFDKRSNRVNTSVWYPFKSKRDLMGSLIIGHTNSMVSRSLYNKFRSIMDIDDIKLPAWATVRDSRARISQLVGCKIRSTMSILDRPCFALSAKTNLVSAAQELSNPMVSPHLDFYPEITPGVDITKFSQSNKWLANLSPFERPQLCQVNGKHFYIFEPVQLSSNAVVIPIYFYNLDGDLHAQCFQIQRENISSAFFPLQDGHTQVGIKITIPPNLIFNHMDLKVIPVDQFVQDYAHIYWGNGNRLVQECGGKIFGEKFPYSKLDVCLPNIFSCASLEERTNDEFLIPNPWRVKSGGRILRHVPITLYSDDTSGNVSKQFNKHNSFYFTLSGLPPEISNQEYNCHFLSTSNVATVGEMGELIIDELNEMVTIGFPAYDYSIHEPVWVISVVLCFLADSPMHAKITNTPNPGASLNPCRMCRLSVKTKQEKKSMKYVQDFLHLDEEGYQRKISTRSWYLTKQNTYDLFMVATQKNISQAKNKGKIYGLKDPINTQLLIDSEGKGNKSKQEALIAMNNDPLNRHRIYNPFLNLKGFDGVDDTPVEVLHVVLLGVVKYLARDFVASVTAKEKYKLIARLESFDSKSLNITSLKPAYLIQHIKSLVGRDLKIILQAAPFIFYDLMSPEKISIWSALCKLAPLIFQTHIQKMDQFIEKLENHIDVFLLQLIKSSAQWVNKPKVHMLRHLPESIRQFGPASLFSTEKFESYNGVLRKASVHSNKQAPGRDIAISFNNYSSLRYILSGGVIYDHSTGKTRQIGPEKASQDTTHPTFPIQTTTKLASPDESPIPQELKLLDPKATFVQIAQASDSKFSGVGKVNSVWKSTHGNRITFFCHLTTFVPGDVEPHYDMRQLVRAKQDLVVNVKNIVGCVNIQHNCHRGKCPIVKTKTTQMERQETDIKDWQVEHSDDQHFIINSASLHDPALHQRTSNLPLVTPTPRDWSQAMAHGFAVWTNSPIPALDEADEDDKEYGDDDDMDE